MISGTSTLHTIYLPPGETLGWLGTYLLAFNMQMGGVGAAGMPGAHILIRKVAASAGRFLELSQFFVAHRASSG